jgi:hypothetical protein
MSLTAIDSHAITETASVPFERASLLVSASLGIEADTQRVLYAFAIPEYIEAWLQLPGMERIECHPWRRSFDRFRITLFSRGGRRGSIDASCILSKPDKITYLWDVDCTRTCSKSIVDIRLRGNSSRCTLRLEHRGFFERTDAEWYFRIWDGSLGNLRELMEGCRTA